MAVTGLLGITLANKSFAPEMYSTSGPIEIATALAAGQNHSVFDLNVNIREIRNAHIARLSKAPEIAVLGASHWQEAHADLLPGAGLYNAHVHRDYYEDLLAVAGMFVRHDKLPRTMVIAIRDNLFTPIDERQDHLWLPGIPYYRSMARELGIAQHSYLSTLPIARGRELISIAMLFENVTRWYKADERPHASTQRYFKRLDTLLPDGSIVWSREHRAHFTDKRAHALAEASAAYNATRPPKIDPDGVAAVDTLIGYLKARNVEVTLAVPPFNPVYFDRVRESDYMRGLRRVDAVIRRLADKHALRVIGSFDPDEVGCTADMYIDSEHSNPQCLSKVFDQLLPGGANKPFVIADETTVRVANPGIEASISRLKVPETSRELAVQQHAIAENLATRPVVGRSESAVTSPRTRITAEPRQVAGSLRPAGLRPASDVALERPAPNAPAAETPAAAPRVRVKKVAHERTMVGSRSRVRGERIAAPELVWPGDAGSPRRRRAAPAAQSATFEPLLQGG